MKGNIALYEKNLTTYYLSYYICSNENFSHSEFELPKVMS